MFPVVSLWRRPPIGSPHSRQVSSCVGLPHLIQNNKMVDSLTY